MVRQPSNVLLLYRLSVMILFLVFPNACVETTAAEYDDEDYPQPEQIHLSFGASETEMIVTWITESPGTTSIVEFGPKVDIGIQLTRRAVGNTTLYEVPGSKQRKLYIHRVTLTQLTPGVKYTYRCGDPSRGMSAIYWFRALSNSATFQPTLLIFGDLGNKNGQSLSLLQVLAQSGTVDAVLHVGDLAYDLEDDNGRRGDEFMRQIEPIAAYVPYQVCPGNHEYHYNFSSFNARFSMFNRAQARVNNHYYSFDVGPVHIVSLSTEFYYFLQFGYRQLQQQYDWLVKDLTEANLNYNREKRPWIFLLAHRPMYCTNLDEADCTSINSITRTGMPFGGDFALEPLLKTFGVDIVWAGHEHSYERLWPLFNGTVSNGTQCPYSNPRAPVHIVTGSAGNEEGLSPFGQDSLHISAFRENLKYTVSRVRAVNKTNIIFEQISVPNGDVIDTVEIYKSTAFPAWQESDFFSQRN